MAKKNYYAVKQGKVPGIYRTWDACKAQVHGYPGAIYKGFERLEEAEAFLGGGKMPEPLLRETKGTYFAAPERKAVQSTAAPDPSSWDWEHLILAEKPCEDPEYAGVGRSAVAYVDGSYQHALGKFSCGVVLFLDGKELNLAEEYSDPDLVSMRNVAGEIKGAELAMAYCLTHDIPELAIYHDYQGIASWCTREWQAKKQGTIDYRNFYDLASAKVAIRFCKVKGPYRRHLQRKSRSAGKTGTGLINSRENGLSYTEKSSIMNGMRKFTTTYYKLSSNGKFPEGNGFRLAFISDLHNMEFGPDNTVLKAVIDEAAPDLVIIGGDQIVAKPGENLDPGLSFAERLAEEYQVIYGCGNHEYRLKLYPEQYGDLYEKLRERLKKAGICYLENETADLTISGCPVRIYGYAMDRTYYNRFYRGPLPVSELTDHLGKPDPARYGILLAHHPAYRSSYASYGADLTLSGHYHGGVVGLGAHRGLVTPDFRLFSKNCRGLFLTGGTCQIISAGTGEHTIPVRIWNRRELIITDIGKP